MSQQTGSLISCTFVCLLLAFFAGQSLPVEGANILGVFTSHSPSHLIIHMSAMKALAEAGHNVTVVCTSVPKVTHKSIKQIVIPLTEEEEKQLNAGMTGMAKEKPSIINTFKNLLGSLSMYIDKQVDVLEDKRFTDLYKNKDNKFDAVVFGFFFNYYQVGLGSLFNCPLILSWTSAPMSIVDESVGNPELIALVPSMNVAVKPGQAMNFKQRLANYFGTTLFRFIGFYLETKNVVFYDRLWGKIPDMISYDEAKKNVSLALCNSHAISEGPVRPNVPAVIEIGGIQIKEKPDPLPQDMQEFLDNAKNGAILLSLGSNLKSENVKPESVEKIFETLSKLKQRVIWKWDDLKHTPGKSANILYKSWLPQDDILAHPNIKLFITHAGKGGVAESLYHAKPMLALPVFADQPNNADKLVQSGYGIRVDLLTLEADEFKASIKELLQNPIYTKNVQAFSKLYRDRPMSARESVVYWVNYVLRHHGAAHMQSPLVHMNFIAASNLDVYAFLAFVLFIASLISFVVLRFCYRKCCGGKGKPQKSSQKSKVKKH
ncbi:UDP-glucosyltransferase 2 [Drosophila grimshawi]|uniref:GH11568 n=1 Tax=Drosophila grimshawi TaxID=7222 RepID=B4JBJ9_DROGR|nr:UDP-glucosyltransferase 2 [Drosophila grimshawi]XP_032592095.1 UDP-glucosyltransferase 2 [Drosophila grimshawi]EDW04022.1 GH11568 [Drosophila grimshawi]